MTSDSSEIQLKRHPTPHPHRRAMGCFFSIVKIWRKKIQCYYDGKALYVEWNETADVATCSIYFLRQEAASINKLQQRPTIQGYNFLATKTPRPRFNIETVFSVMETSIIKVRPSYLTNGNPFTGKTASLHWDGIQEQHMTQLYFLPLSVHSALLISAHNTP